MRVDRARMGVVIGKNGKKGFERGRGRAGGCYDQIGYVLSSFFFGSK